MYSDLVAITPEQYFKQITKRLAEIKAVSVSVAMEDGPSRQSARPSQNRDSLFGKQSMLFVAFASSFNSSTFLFQSPDERGVIVQILESGYRFVLGSIGGGKFVRFHRSFTLFAAVEIFGIPDLFVLPMYRLKKKKKNCLENIAFSKLGRQLPREWSRVIGNKRN